MASDPSAAVAHEPDRLYMPALNAIRCKCRLVHSRRRSVADTDGRGYSNIHHFEPKAKAASVRPKAECAYCYIANAKKDAV
jgi:hypothetical protein